MLDENTFIEMVSDESLHDVGLDNNCREWMKDWILESKKLAEQDDPKTDYLAYAIQHKEKETTIGSVGCSYYVDLNKVEIIYFVGAQYRNNDYASEAIRAYVRYSFEHYKMDEIIATIREDNMPSWKTIEESVFSLVNRKLYRDINDNTEEMYRFYSQKRSL